MKPRRALTHTLVLSLILTLIPATPVRPATKQETDEQAKRGLRFRLSEGSERVENVETPNALVQASPLSERETQKLLARLPAIRPEPDDAQGFRLRENSLPPPRAGETIQAAFAPPSPSAMQPQPETTAPLAVLRYAPEGEVALAPALSITFSQPMVAVASQGEAAASVPVTLAPQPKGSWRWLGTQTLVFQPEAEGGRLPMATAYTVNIPAGTKSALGNALPETKTFNFATPPPTLKSSHPSGQGQLRDALMFLEFDQRIDAARVLEKLVLQPAASGLRLRLATPKEIAADETVKELVKRSQEGRWLALKAVTSDGSTKDALPVDTDIRIVVPPGTPSAEGPRATTIEQSFVFKTYGPLRVTGTECGYNKSCSPFDQMSIVFSNTLYFDSATASKVTITPEIPGVTISAAGNSLIIQGTKRSNTTYTVTLAPSLKDLFGQTLTGDHRVTFKVNEAGPRMFSTSQNFVVLDPAGRRTFSVYSINYRRLKVRLYKVTPDDWARFRFYQVAVSHQKEKAQPPGTLAFERVVDLKGNADEMTETAINLSPALTNGHGQVFVQVEPVEEKDAPVRVYAYPEQGRVDAWVQATDIGLDAFVGQDGPVVWANSLRDGSPLAGVEISVVPENATGVTGADGLARFKLEEFVLKGDPKPALLVARRGEDAAILPNFYSDYYFSDVNNNVVWRAKGRSSERGWYVFDDRKLYRPGEEVNIKGWLRQIVLTPTGDTEMIDREGEPIVYTLKDRLGNEITKGSVPLNALAGFDFKLRLPPTMNLGEAELEIELERTGESYTHTFQVQEFRRPEFEITASASEAPHFVGSSATVTMAATYYTGGGLADTEVNWTVTSQPMNYTPPNRDDYTFGKFHPWWGNYNEGRETHKQEFNGKTDARGKHVLRIDFDGVNPPRPSYVRAAAVVQDVNRQTLSALAELLVHPADVYVGLKSARTFVQQGDPFDIEAIVTDLDGRALAGRDVVLRLVRLDYVYEGGEWQQKERDAQEQTIKSGADGVSVRLATKAGGEYRLTARVLDARERPNESELMLWVAGGKLPPVREVAQEKVELIPNRKTYAGGEVAEILVQSPFAPAEGVLSLRRSGLLKTERFTMTESSYTLRVPIEEAMTPNVRVQVDLVGAQSRVDDAGKTRTELPKRTAFASGELNLSIPPATRRLNVTATPRDTVLEPGAETFVDVLVKDAQGRSVTGTDTAVIVVDEAVLALTNYRLADPLSIFYPEREAGVSDYHLREKLKLASPEEVEQMALGGGLRGSQTIAREITGLPVTGRAYSALIAFNRGAMDGVNYSMTETMTVMSAEDGSPIELRKNFNALAVFTASVPTDAAGRARVRVKLPDNLTRYRVAAVTVAGGRLAGAGESVITARKGLMVRPSAPRFLNFGDRAELPVVLQNPTNDAVSVNVAVRATNAELTAGAGRSVVVPANNRVEVRFPVAALLPGTVHFQVVTSSGRATDAAEVSLPVYTPATTEAFATYGVIDEGSVAQPVKAPADAVQSFGGLEVTTASTQLQELTDAVIYLYTYPYECSEQIASRVIALAALKDVLAAFKAKELPSPQAMSDSVNADLKTLGSLQNDDGGFDFWRRTERSVPFLSVHVAHALARAESNGFPVPQAMLEKAHDYLLAIEEKIPGEYSPEAKRAIHAYALYVRALMKDPDPQEARWLINDAGGIENLSLESLGWLLQVLPSDAYSASEIAAIRRHLNNRVTETAGAAHFADSYSDGAFTVLESDRRADGVLLDALINDQPQSDLIPKLVRGLLGGRKRGRWLNTQENVFILLALDRYFNTYEKTTPNFVARVWLGQAYAGERIFKGRSVDRQQLNLPMAALAERTAKAPANLTIGKEGAGRLYFRIGTRYAPSNLTLAAADYGFKVERRYEGVDDPTDVRRDADGTWHVKAGARVRVRLVVSNAARRYHVALVDPLPAGLEALNPELAVTESLPDESSEESIFRGGRGIYDYYWYRRGPWYEHQNLRDERAEAFTSLLWEGTHEYTYFARATTPGLFVVPPAKAEEMYAPETFGRGQSDRVRVE